MNILKMTAVVAVALTLVACAQQEAPQQMVSEEMTSSKL